jgi:hypothetical protein
MNKKCKSHYRILTEFLIASSLYSNSQKGTDLSSRLLNLWDFFIVVRIFMQMKFVLMRDG